jgi:hypothetical protein
MIIIAVNISQYFIDFIFTLRLNCEVNYYQEDGLFDGYSLGTILFRFEFPVTYYCGFWKFIYLLFFIYRKETSIVSISWNCND